MIKVYMCMCSKCTYGCIHTIGIFLLFLKTIVCTNENMDTTPS